MFTSIVELSQHWRRLKNKRLFKRIFDVYSWQSHFSFPKNRLYEKQTIVFLENKITGEAGIFNPIRGLRPKPLEKIKLSYKKDPFRNPEKFSPINNEFGTLKNKYALTSDNLTKICRWHGLVIFKKHSSFRFSPAELYTGFLLAEQWFEKVKEKDRKSIYRLIFWNNLYRAGASQAHKHWQLTATPVLWQKEKKFQEAIDKYQRQYHANYFDDFIKITNELGLGRKIGRTQVIVNLTPFKEKEMIFLPKTLDLSFFKILVKCLRQLGYLSFNLVFYLDLKPPIVRLVDRGQLSELASDIGAMELYAAPVIVTDPFVLAKKLNIIKLT